MRVAFFQGGSRWKFDKEGNQYTDANLNQSIWDRYLAHVDAICVVLREDRQIYSSSIAHASFNEFDSNKIQSVVLPDLYQPRVNFLSPFLRGRARKLIRKAIEESDYLIIREIGNFYTDYAVEYARRINRPYLVEVTSDIHEVLRKHGTLGKILSYFETVKCRKAIRDAPYVIYVTNSYLQNLYPTTGKSLGCSDVDVSIMSREEVVKKLSEINGKNTLFHIGTAGYLDVDAKGQKDVIKAIAILSEQGINNIKYHLLGSGTGAGLIELAQELGVASSIELDGAVPHEKVASWIDELDLYIHPSYAEGLSRSIIEAMSRGCPTICSDIGGNYELVAKRYRFQCSNIDEIAQMIINMIDAEARRECAEEAYNSSLEFDSMLLDEKRSAFLSDFFVQNRMQGKTCAK